MEQQEKVKKRMDYQNGNAKNLHGAKYRANDEFYTSLNDIYKELNHYGKYFKGKNIICPCDCDILEGKSVYKIVIEFEEESEEWFASATGYINRVKQLTYYTFENDTYIPTVITGDAARDFISENIICNFIKAIVDIGEDFGAKSITASGYDTKVQEGILFEDVDYSMYDLIITNPPFSQYRKFMDTILPYVRGRKNTSNPLDFILLSSFKNRINPVIGLGLMLGEFYLGFGRHKTLNFNTPCKETGYKVKQVAVDWVTTFPDAQNECDENKMLTGVNYDLYKDGFEVLKTITMKDGTHPIRINHQKNIPDDYMGWMQVSGGVLTNLSNKEFEWYITNAKKYYNTENPDYNPFAHKATDTMLNFHGVVLRRKKVAKNI